MKLNKLIQAILIACLFTSCSEDEDPIEGVYPVCISFGAYITIEDDEGKDLLDANHPQSLYNTNICLTDGNDSYALERAWTTTYNSGKKLQFIHCTADTPKEFGYNQTFPSYDESGAIYESIVSTGKTLALFFEEHVVWSYNVHEYNKEKRYTLSIGNVAEPHTIDIKAVYGKGPGEWANFSYILDGEETALPIRIVVPRSAIPSSAE